MKIDLYLDPKKTARLLCEMTEAEQMLTILELANGLHREPALFCERADQIAENISIYVDKEGQQKIKNLFDMLSGYINKIIEQEEGEQE